MVTPTYSEAIKLLNSTQTGYKVLEERKKAGIVFEHDDPIAQMRTWMSYIGYASSDLDKLNVVHVAGTKGKGTTCAYTNSILEQYRVKEGDASSPGPRKIGLFTSPHLVAVRERIRINSKALSEEDFTRYFFEVWNAFEAGAKKQGDDPTLKPSYFRFLTLLSFHVFLREGVDAAIYEVGVGGLLDATNVFVKPCATAVTTLGIDHVYILGNTIEQISHHKAGVFKKGVPAFTIPQEPAAQKVLEVEAAKRPTDLVVLDTDAHDKLFEAVKLSPNEPFQRKNASLAVALATEVLGRLGVPDIPRPSTANPEKGPPKLTEKFRRGLETVEWRGRCERTVTGRQHWYLDGAHNEQSLEVACRWFVRALSSDRPDNKVPTVLLFNQQSSRDAVELLKQVYETVSSERGYHGFDYAIFCTNVTYKNNSWKADFVNKNVDPASLKTLELQKELAGIWEQLDPDAKTSAMPSIQDAIEYIRSINDGKTDIDVFVTGSFHLVGGVLTNLEGEDFALNMTS